MIATPQQIRDSMCRIARGWYNPRIDNFDQLYLGCESPIERKFIGFSSAMFAQDVKVTGQEELMGGKYRADFVARRNGRAVMIECDGRGFHHFRDDLKRDLEILCYTTIDTIIRLRGCDIQYMQIECGQYLERFAPELFGAAVRKVDGIWLRFGMPNDKEGCKPIIRTKYPRADVMACIRDLNDSQTVNVYGRPRTA